MSSLGEQFPKEQARCRKVLGLYKEIGPNGRQSCHPCCRRAAAALFAIDAGERDKALDEARADPDASKWHRFQFECGPILRGGKVRLDGKEVRGVRSVKVEADVNDICQVTLELSPESIDVDVDVGKGALSIVQIGDDDGEKQPDIDEPARDACHRAAKVLVEKAIGLKADRTQPALQAKLLQVAKYLKAKHG